MTVDLDRLAELLVEAADMEIMPHVRRLDPDAVRAKGSAIDLVTAADEAAERLIGARCAALWPQALFVGEEGCAADPGLLPRLAGAELAIVVDPIDGTSNFAAGLPLFAVMAAVLANGHCVGALIYDPVGRAMLRAEAGAGAEMMLGGERRRVRSADPVPLEDMIGTGCATYFPDGQRRGLLSRLAAVAVFANYGCSGHEYWLAATGHSHFVFANETMPWDHLPGTLILAEAGGIVRRLDGSRYRPEHREGGLLAACDAASWDAVNAALFAP